MTPQQSNACKQLYDRIEQLRLERNLLLWAYELIMHQDQEIRSLKDRVEIIRKAKTF